MGASISNLKADTTLHDDVFVFDLESLSETGVCLLIGRRLQSRACIPCENTHTS